MGEGGAGGLSHLSCPHYLPVTPEVTSPGSVTHSVVHHSGPSSGPGSGPVTNGKAWGASGSEDRSLLGAVGSGEGHVGERSYVHACSAFPPDLGPALHFRTLASLSLMARPGLPCEEIRRPAQRCRHGKPGRAERRSPRSCPRSFPVAFPGLPRGLRGDWRSRTLLAELLQELGGEAAGPLPPHGPSGEGPLFPHLQNGFTVRRVSRRKPSIRRLLPGLEDIYLVHPAPAITPGPPSTPKGRVQRVRAPCCARREDTAPATWRRGSRWGHRRVTQGPREALPGCLHPSSHEPGLRDHFAPLHHQAVKGAPEGKLIPRETSGPPGVRVGEQPRQDVRSRSRVGVGPPTRSWSIF